MMNKPIVI